MVEELGSAQRLINGVVYALKIVATIAIGGWAVLLIFIGLTGGAMGAPLPTAPGGNCGSHEATTEQLREKYKEVPVWYGLTGNGAVMQMYASKDSWTLLIVFPNGNSCLVGAGGEHEYAAPAPPSKDI